MLKEGICSFTVKTSSLMEIDADDVYDPSSFISSCVDDISFGSS